MPYDKKLDLAGPGISTYEKVLEVLPENYDPILSRKDTQKAIQLAKMKMEEGLCKRLNLFRIECPLILEKASGMNDYLDRDGSRTPVDFEAGLGLEKRIEAQVVQAATKWKRFALEQFECDMHEGIYTDMRAVRKDYFLDHDHSSYVDQWDWERVITPADRNLGFLKETVRALWATFLEADAALRAEFKPLAQKLAPLPRELVFLHAEEILAMYPTLPRKERETLIVQKFPGVFIIGIGATLKDGYPHEMRAADYDDWCTPTVKGPDGDQYYGLNGDILMWNFVTKRRHELSSMGIRVTKETLVQQLKETNQEHFLQLPYHKMILADEIPLSIGGGIGQSRTYQYLLGKAALGECSVTIWPHQLHEACESKGIRLLR
ncbi:MAG: aspartate--ammonia ligase [Pseudomonadota bacterium]